MKHVFRTAKSLIRFVAIYLSRKCSHLEPVKTQLTEWYGNNYGGFYLNPQLLNESSVVYSFGVGEDLSFDSSVIQRHSCKVYAFDPTPKSISWYNSVPKAKKEGILFFDFGIGPVTRTAVFYPPKNLDHISGSIVKTANVDELSGYGVKLVCFRDIAEQLGHSRVDVVKMDIEGAEYDVILNILDSDIDVIQLAVEFHDRFFPGKEPPSKEIVAVMASNGFHIFARSMNYQEISFVNTKYLSSLKQSGEK